VALSVHFLNNAALIDIITQTQESMNNNEVNLMNDVIGTILNHRSIRHFEDKPLTEEQIKTIVSCAQAASTSSFIQAYSIIGVKDPVKKKKLAELAGNQE